MHAERHDAGASYPFGTGVQSADGVSDYLNSVSEGNTS